MSDICFAALRQQALDVVGYYGRADIISLTVHCSSQPLWALAGVRLNSYAFVILVRISDQFSTKASLVQAA
ncbi:hypothetical protein ACT3UM_10565 [Halomonas sp. AOP13-D3-9]